MTVLYKERNKNIFEAILDEITGYIEIRKDSEFITAVQDMISAVAVFNNL